MTSESISWDETMAMKIACKVAVRKMPMFHHFREFCRDDLYQAGLEAIVRNHNYFDATKSSLPTWYYRIASCRLLDLHRGRTRIARNEGIAASLLPAEGYDDQDLIDLSDDEALLTVPEWLRAIYQHARRTLIAGRYRQGRRFFNVAQVMAASMLVEREGLTERGATERFRSDDELRGAIRFLHTPSPRWFGLSRDVCATIIRGFSSPQRAAFRRLLEHPLRTERITV